jgi:predicted TIM-barrel fold metal-dependent hydrolase
MTRGRQAKSGPERALESPIPFTTGSNGEFAPRAKTARDRQAETLFHRIVDENSRRQGVSRRDFLDSVCGTAAALFVINQVYGCDSSQPGADGGGFTVDAASTVDAGKACEELAGHEFIFDVQTHHVNPLGPWRESSWWPYVLASFPQGSCGEADAVDCFDTNHYIREMFLNSDTSVAVLSAVPADVGENPLTAEEAKATRELVETLSGSPRLVTHGLVLADLGQSQLDGMQALAEAIGIGAWKVYTQYGGWWLDDPAGIAFIERARELGVKRVCAHKGLTLGGFDPAYASPRDLGVVAAAYPDVAFIAYHSGYETSITEGAYDAANPQGVDQLIKAMADNGLAPGSNLYAELGSTWRNVMTSPTEAAHLLGKLLLHVGEDRILWGTDSIWYGTPQDQINAFRTFQISTALQETHGYPALTDEIRQKILGKNAAALYGIDPDATLCEIADDALARRKRAVKESGDGPLPTLRDFGPRTRRELFAFLRGRGGAPG